MVAFKQKEQAQLAQHNSRFLEPKDMISVQFYDSLSGLDKETLEIVMQKINEVKEMAQFKLASMVKMNMDNVEKIQQYREMAPDDYGLLQYSIEEIMEKMPRLCKDVQKVWDLLHTAYGKECFTPMIIKKFPNQFNVNLSNTNK